MQRLRNLLLISTALMPLAFAPAIAGPVGGTVVGGSATINNPGSANVTINQHTDKAIINWYMFDIGAGEKTTFVQPSVNSIALNKVVGGQGPSQILGSLDANGKVFLINRDGIIFGPGAVITTAGFLATTSDIRNSDFMAGRFTFNIPGRPDASIVNMGKITATNGGFAALVAPGVRNSGIISAKLGTVALGAGNIFNLDFYGDRLITLGVGDEIATQVKDVATGQTLKSLITNEGKLKANGGRVELTAAAARVVVDSVINTSGVIEANSVGTKGGQIVLSAATTAPIVSTGGSRGQKGTATASALPPQKVKVSGTLSAAGKKAGTKGGTIIVTGEHIELAGATIDASGREGGGKVMIGGDWGGGKPDMSLVSNPSAKLESFSLPNASTVSVDAATKIDASAKDRGDGGKVIVWSDQTTTFAGTILALGGREIGNGGFAEVSGKGLLNYTGVADLRAPNGSAGTLLLDPENFTVWNGIGPAPAGSSIVNTTLQNQLQLASVTIATNNGINPPGQNGDIFVNAQIVWNASTTLTLSAFHDIRINDVGVNGTIKNTGAGNLILRADSTGTNSGTVILPASTFSNRVDWSASTGTVSIYYNPGNGYTSPVDYTSTANTGVGGGFGGNVVLASPSQLTAYMLVNSTAQLGSLNTNLNGNYAIGPTTLSAVGFGGFAPGTTFNGTLTGNGGLGTNSTISGLTTSLFPMIGSTGKVSDLALTGVNVAANANNQFLGPIAGQNAGTITNVNVLSGTVNGGTFTGIIAGGLVGQNSGNLSIHNSSSAASVTVGNGTTGPGGGNSAGGLAGINQGLIANSTSTGIVQGGANAFIGGLAGRNDGTISASSASGNVTTTAANAFGIAAGGLAGSNGVGSTITGSSASGNVTTGNGGSAGGLVGQNEGTISASSASGNVSGTGTSSNIVLLGGLVANNHSNITNSSATGTVSTGGFASIGGLIGSNTGNLSNLSASNALVLNGNSVTAGGLIGNNSGNLTNVFATNNVTASGNQVTLGGLVGFNFGTITNGRASGNVTSTANATGMFDASAAGGLVGSNNGSIIGSVQPNAGTSCAAGASCATGAVSVGSHGNAGGLAGFHSGTITNSFATGAVTGGPGLSQNTPTNLGGLVGLASGSISGSHARGNVGSNVVFLSAGGLVGDNGATISNSFAIGNVTAGNQSQAGGLVGANGGDCLGCTGNISNSSASGNVTVGTASFAGGLAGSSGEAETFTNLSASGAVTGGSNSVIGGLLGALGPSATLTNSQASGGAVSSIGTNVMAGGLIGMSFGAISNSTTSKAVSVANESFAGGLVGGNLGRIENSNTLASATVTGGSSSVLGGLASLNAGTITQSSAANAVTTGNFGAAGGLVGANIVLEGVPPGLVIAGSSFPSGTIVSSTATGAVTGGANTKVGGLIGVNGGSISGLTSSATVSGGDGSTVGGLVGMNSGPVGGPNLPTALTGCPDCGFGSISVSSGPGSIANSTASGHVSGGSLSIVGGLVGDNPGTITNSQSSIAINQPNAFLVGGLVGLNDSGASIVNSSASGAVSGSSLAIGGLAGSNVGSISGSSASGNVTGGLSSTSGGLVGFNTGSIANSNASGNVTGGDGSTLGGLVGMNAGTVTNSFGTGTVLADPSIAGGLVGLNIGTITGSHATGAVTGDAGSFVGGLVGFNLLGTIQNSYSVSKVTVGDGGAAGGLAAVNFGAISQSFATGAVTGGASSYVGGLVAFNFGNSGIPGAPLGTISQSYATGAVTGGAASVVGGLVAENAGSIDQAYAAGRVTGGPGSVTGGLVASNNFTTPSGASSSGSASAAPPGFSSTPGTTTNSYWDTQTTGQDRSAGGTGLTTAQLTNTLPGGFTSPTWTSAPGKYPFFPGQPDPLPVPGDPVVAPTPQPQPEPKPDTPVVAQVAPLVNIVAALVNETFTEKKQDEVINTTTTNSGAGGGSAGAPGGQKRGGQNGGARPNIGFAPYGLGPLPSGMPPLNETRFRNDLVVFQIGGKLSNEELLALARRLGLTILYQEDVGLLGRKVVSFQLPPGQTVRGIIPLLQELGAEFSAQPAYQFEMVQDVAQAPSPADTQRKGDSAQYIVEKLALTEAHLIATGKNVKVAVIDSEIDGKHPDLEGAIAANYDALPSDDQTAHPHGTGMAGAIASHRRLLGVAPGAKLLAVRAFGVNTGGAQGTSMNIVKGLQWAVDQGAKVINMSFAGPRDPILQQAIKRLTDQGIILIAAAGNAGPKSPPLFPGADPNVIAVSATDMDDKTYKNANRGKYVAIAAPGVDILVPAPEGGYQLTTGTSVAAAHISGVVALMLERNKELRSAEVRSILSATAKNIGGAKTDVGAGLVDPVQALGKAGPKQARLH